MSHGPSDHLHTPRGQWWLVVSFFVLTLISGTTGVLIYEHEHFGEAHFLGALYHAAQMLILHTAHFEHGTNWWLEVGRWSGAATAFAAATSLISRRLGREMRRFRLRLWRNHVVVCGLGQKGFEIAMRRRGGGNVRGLQRVTEAFRRLRGSLEDGDPLFRTNVVVIDPAPDHALVEEAEAAGVCVIFADASKPQVLREARADVAAEVVVITPSDQTNVSIASGIPEARGEALTRRMCHVHLSDIHLREALDHWMDSASRCSAGRLRFFDVFDSESRRLLRDHPLDGAGIGPDDDTAVHVVLLGFGRMGRSIALRAAKAGHFANGKLLRISIIGRDADAQRGRFLMRYPALSDDRICELRFHNVEAESKDSRELITRWIAEPGARLHFYMCLDDDSRNLELALRLQLLTLGRTNCQLHARIRSKHKLEPILDGAEGETPRIIPFGMIEDTCSEDALRGGELDRVARAIHERFVARRIQDTRRTPENDLTLRDWEHLRDDLKESNRQQADHFAVKLRAIGCALVKQTDLGESVESLDPTEIEVLAPVEHQRWNAERWLGGWEFGEKKDEKRRISPHLVVWKDLNTEIKKYDFEAIEQIPAIVKSAMLGWKIVRRV